MNVKYYRTTGTSTPDSENLELGEIALSTDNTNPKIFIKKNDEDIAEFIDKDNALLLTSSQTLTSSQKELVQKKLGFCDETVNLFVEIEDESLITSIDVTLTYASTSTTYHLTSSSITLTVPMYETYNISFNTISGYDKPEKITRVASRNQTVELNVKYETSNGYTDLSMVSARGTALSEQETANCYIIRESGKYEFPLVYGCGIMSGETNAAAYTFKDDIHNQPFYNYVNKQITSPYIEEDIQTEASSIEIMYSDEGVTDFVYSGFTFTTKNNIKYLRFEVSYLNQSGGNHVIAIKDKSGQVIWSWHLWVYTDTIADDVKFTYGTNYGNYEIFPLNIGWVKDSYAPLVAGTCPYYQWGRKDPMLRASSKSSNTPASTSSGSFSISACAQSMGTAIQNPNAFFKNGTNSKGGWLSDAYGTPIDIYNYWDSDDDNSSQYYPNKHCNIKTVYDPCPVGYKVPYLRVFYHISSYGYYEWQDYGIKYYTYKGSEYYTYIPAIGYRNGETGAITGLTSTAADRMGLYYYSVSHSTTNVLSSKFKYDYGTDLDNLDYIRACATPIRPVTMRSGGYF